MTEKGLFIVLDGPEGCGKTTQSNLLVEVLQLSGFRASKTFQPGGTELGSQVRHELLHGSHDLTPGQEAIYFTFDRALHIVTVVKPAIDSGITVVCDRFASATSAYQGYAGGLGTSTVEWLTDLATDGLLPNLLLVLDIDPAIGFLRKKGDTLDRIERKPTDFHQMVRQGFLYYAEQHPDFSEVIVADGTLAEVHDRVIQASNERLNLNLPVLDL